MSLKTFTEIMLPAIDIELQHQIARLDMPYAASFREMLTYHMGWTDEGFGQEAHGKRIRPFLLTLTTAACGKDWKSALSAAASVELIHNFSLVHDDIQDKSESRRGRPTVWKKWGEAHAINVGDALFILAQMAMLDIKDKFQPEISINAGAIIHEACLKLCNGQFLDLSYETRRNLSIDDYWPMIAGKTAALISACTQIGALLGDMNVLAQEAYRDFGHYLGLAFQVQDDYLGIWGDSALTGKSIESDLITGKKTLPVLFGLGRDGPFAQRWVEGPIHNDEVVNLAKGLAQEGAKLYTQDIVSQMTDLALRALRTTNPHGEAGEALFELVKNLLSRQS